MVWQLRIIDANAFVGSLPCAGVFGVTMPGFTAFDVYCHELP
jgi:hypothetical protein